jgi:hypothetical protein
VLFVELKEPPGANGAGPPATVGPDLG